MNVPNHYLSTHTSESGNSLLVNEFTSQVLVTLWTEMYYHYNFWEIVYSWKGVVFSSEVLKYLLYINSLCTLFNQLFFKEVKCKMRHSNSKVKPRNTFTAQRLIGSGNIYFVLSEFFWVREVLVWHINT